MPLPPRLDSFASHITQLERGTRFDHAIARLIQNPSCLKNVPTLRFLSVLIYVTMAINLPQQLGFIGR